MPTERSSLSREQIIAAFQKISDELGQHGVKGELCLFGGSVMVLAFTARVSTKDVDAIFQPTREIREIASKVGTEFGFPEHWLNDAAKGFVSLRHEVVDGIFPSFPICD